MLKKSLPILTVLYTVALATICLIRLNNLPNLGISFSDKIFHFFTYALLTVLWSLTFFYSSKQEKKRAIFNGALFSVIYGIIIEVLQGYFTATRALDVYDMVANTLGALLASIVMWFKKSLQVKNN